MFLQFLYALFLDIKDTFEHVNATVNFILTLGYFHLMYLILHFTIELNVITFDLSQFHDNISILRYE